VLTSQSIVILSDAKDLLFAALFIHLPRFLFNLRHYRFSLLLRAKGWRMPY
jgi:hypothetical protein